MPVISPPVRRGMLELDRSAFAVDLPLLAARVPASLTSQFMQKHAKGSVLQLPRIPSVAPEPDNEQQRRLLLRTNDKNQLPAELLEIIQREGGELIQHTVHVDYDYFTASQILDAILPEDLLDESPSSYTQVGHIAHLNLRPEYLPYRHLIGRVILDKNKGLRTVVNKLDTIDTEFRFFKMEVLAGDEDFNVTVSESECMFRFDFSKVYWNSRLQGEHLHLVQSFSPEDVIVDAFAGVGPFAVPAAKRGCAVLASDLNPESAKSLAENVRLNKLRDNIRSGNEDGREYIRQSVLELWRRPFPPYVPPISAKERSRRQRKGLPPVEPASETSEEPKRRLPDHYVMNLPASAIDFLDAFRGLYKPLLREDGATEAINAKGRLPMVHCYCFTKEIDNPEDDILARASKSLGLTLTRDQPDYRLRFVRDVAPKKEMYCLEFRLTDDIVY